MPADRQIAETATLPAPDPILGLDIIRLGAAAYVMLFHLGFGEFVLAGSTLTRAVEADAILPYTWWWCGGGWIGVEIFFVLSGVVISASLEGNTGERFLARRLLRLYPAVWICASASLLAATVSAMRGPESPLGAYMRAMALTPFGPWIENSYWTLPVEMMFYLIVGVCLLSNRRKYVSETIGFIGFASVAYWLVAQSGLVAASGAGPLQGPASALVHSDAFRSLDLTLIGHGCFFAMGALIYRVCVSRAAGAWAMQGVILMGGCWLEIVIVTHRRAVESGYDLPLFAPAIVWTAAVALMALSTLYRRPIARFCGPTAGRWARFAGLMTYPLYLCHVSVGFAAIKGLRALGLPPVAAWLGGFVAAALVAAVVAGALEPRVRRLTQSAMRRMAASRTALIGVRS